MNCLAHVLAGAAIMMTGAWVANMVPPVRGRRLLWALGWGMPAGLAVLISGVEPVEALWLGCAATAGGMVPASPSEQILPGRVIRDLVILLLEACLRLLPVALLLWAYDLYWPKAVEAAGFILPAYVAGHALHDRLHAAGWWGLRNSADFGAIVFAGAVGALLAVTPLLPDHPEWPPIPAELAPLDQSP